MDTSGLHATIDLRWTPKWWVAKARPTAIHMIQMIQNRNTCAHEGPHTSQKRKRFGPCSFSACKGSPYTNAYGNVGWYTIPTPCPWFGVLAGATVCTRHRAIAVKSARRAKHFCHTAWTGGGALPGTATKRAPDTIADHLPDEPPHRRAGVSKSASSWE